MFQQTPIFCDVARYFAYAVRQTASDEFVTISTAGESVFGSVTLKPQCYFVATALRAWTNYDDVAPVLATANSVAILPRAFTPNNFTLKIDRGNSNSYSNTPMSQAEICSSGYRAGKVFPFPVVYGPRSNFQFTFQDLTGLFLLDATGGGGDPVPLEIHCFIEGYSVPIRQWERFCTIFPSFSRVFSP